MGFTQEQLDKLASLGLSFVGDEVNNAHAEAAAVSLKLEDVIADSNTMWVLLCSALVFFMQTGFAMLCAGCVRAKNTKNILMKNVLDACTCGVGFWAIGYGVGYGEKNGGHPFIGNDYFFLINLPPGKAYAGWLFQFGFAATAATIVSGAVAERTKMIAYFYYSAILTMFVYPVVVHWMWSSSGWLSAFGPSPLLGSGAIDCAGCGAIHMVGGLTALIGARAVGPRMGRFDTNGQPVEFPGHSSAMQVLGALILWVGWFGFNPGSAGLIVGLDKADTVARAAICTSISAASGALACLATSAYRLHQFDLNHTINGALAGLVSITAGCHVVPPWAALVIGIVGSQCFLGFSWLMSHVFKIDDVVDAAAVHLPCGAWGLIGASFFATKEAMDLAYGNPNQFYGAFMAPRGQGHQIFVCNLIAVLAIIGWVTAVMTPFFVILRYLGLLRVSMEDETVGIDISKHGGSAYFYDAQTTYMSKNVVASVVATTSTAKHSESAAAEETAPAVHTTSKVGPHPTTEP